MCAMRYPLGYLLWYPYFYCKHYGCYYFRVPFVHNLGAGSCAA